MNELHFLRPAWLLALLPLGWLAWQSWHQKLASPGWRAVCDAHLLPHLLVGEARQARRWPAGLIGAAGLLAVIALAGPTWKQLPQPVFRSQNAMVIVLDLSRSMNATDVKPSRLIRARLKLRDLLARHREGQTALVVYAGDAFTVSPVTDDTATIDALVPVLRTSLMPAPGSNTESALRRARDLLAQAGAVRGEIILITDGASPSEIGRAHV